MFPIRGYPFGPGRWGGPFLFLRHFKTRAKDAAAESEATNRAFLLLISGDKLGRESADEGSH